MIKGKLAKFLSAKKHLNAAGKRLLEIGVKEFVLTAYPRIPVWSGMARSTLAPLGRSLNLTIPVDPRFPTASRNPQAGEDASSFKWSTVGNAEMLEWSTSVKHFFLNEQFAHPRVASAPWFSLLQGKEAARRAIQETARDMIIKAITLSVSYEEIK